MAYDHDDTFPMLAPLVWRLPLDRLKAIAAAVGAPAPDKREAGLPAEWACNIRDHLADPRELRGLLTSDDLRIIGESYTFGTRAAWEAKNAGKSFDAMVQDLVFQRAKRKKLEAAPRPNPTRAKVAKPMHTAAWPELASAKALRAADAKTLARALATALGKGFEPVVRKGQAPAVKDTASGVIYVIVPGGKARIGLTPAEAKKIAPIAKRLGEEATMHLAALRESAAPAKEIAFMPFLCAQSPLTKAQAALLGAKTADVTPVHDIALFDPKVAAKAASKAKARLLSDAEWEYVARAGAGRSWLSGDVDPAAFVRSMLRAKLLAGDAPFGVFGLPWGTWVDDLHQVPEVMRGGGAPMLVPWQLGAEAMLLLTAHKERRKKGSAPVIVARDLPKRPANVS